MEFIPVTHSVPHGFATAFHTPQGVIMHTGDWKLDLTPVDGRLTDLARMGAIAYDQGVRLLLGDSTNADSHGHSRSEKSVGAVLYDLFHEHEGRRIVIACFASHIHRVQQIADAAIAFGRKVATLGLSMKKNMRLAREMGLLHIPESSIVDIEDIGDLADGDVCVISTGSQGEPMSALTRMANGENRWLTIGEGDTVILSSHPIPGNEMDVSKVIDGLVRLGAKVVHSGIEDVHATGHAKQEEIKTLLSIVEPQWFVPVHGEYRHLVANAELGRRRWACPRSARSCAPTATSSPSTTRASGSPARCRPATSTSTASSATSARACSATGGCSPRRAWWSSSSRVAIEDGAILTGPEIITRGWVYAPEAEALLDECADVVRQAIKDLFVEAGTPDLESLQRAVRRAAGRFVNDRTKRKPDDRPGGDGGVVPLQGERVRAAPRHRGRPGRARGVLRGARGVAGGGRWTVATRSRRTCSSGDDPDVTVYVIEVEGDGGRRDPELRGARARTTAHAGIDISVAPRVARHRRRPRRAPHPRPPPHRRHAGTTASRSIPNAANGRAIAAYTKLGFQPVGILRQYERGRRRHLARRPPHGPPRRRAA